MFTAKLAVIGTMHNKERVIAPLLEKELGFRTLVTSRFNTDELGTFSREIPRRDDALTTVRTKARLALQHCPEADFAVASEGSFGPHPTLPFVPGGTEIVILIDRNSQLEILGTDITTLTNYRSILVASVSEGQAFAMQVGFPEHGLLLMGAPNEVPDPSTIVKGITEPEILHTTLKEYLAKHSRVWIETDMRAHKNPTRMASIERATMVMVQAARRCCPQCELPGFAPKEVLRGLPCEDCDMPTQRQCGYLYRCNRCGYEHQERLNTTEFAPAKYCTYCNP